MKIFVEPYQLKLPKDPNRSEGLHLSDIIRELAIQMGYLDKKYDVPMVDKGSEIAQLGIAFEDYLAKYQYPNSIDFHPTELTMDGIIMSPDGFGLVDDDDYAALIGVEVGSFLLHEFKLSRKSSRRFQEALEGGYGRGKAWAWLTQIKSYRLALNKFLEGTGVPPCNIAKLHVFFVNGSYAVDSSPEYIVYRLHFSDKDLAESWELILSHAETMRSRNV